MSTLAEQQAALVRALVGRAAIPAGFDPARIDATISSLLRKRADEVARAWPALMADGAARRRFLTWADGRPKTTSYADGLAFACEQRDRGNLDTSALRELDARTRRGRWGRWGRWGRRRHPIIR